MDVSTRPSKKHRQLPALFKRGLAVLSFSALCIALPSSLSAATGGEEPKASEIVSSIAQDASHEVAIRNVGAGNEEIALSARLSTTTNILAERVSWEIRSKSGELLHKGEHTEFNTKLSPGQFTIEARYGAVSIREELTLVEGHALTVNFVLNAGGLRVLPVMKDMQSEGMDSHTLVYALSGPGKGRLISHSRTPGEILKLAAGQYRVESRLGQGNAVAVMDVRVRPGRMSAIEVKHQVGVARLSFVGSADATVDWSVSQVGGAVIAQASGLNQALALRPGFYLAEASVNGETLTAKFKITAGQERDILLGN
jgi:hypothetical protein